MIVRGNFLSVGTAETNAMSYLVWKYWTPQVPPSLHLSLPKSVEYNAYRNYLLIEKLLRGTCDGQAQG